MGRREATESSMGKVTVHLEGCKKATKPPGLQSPYPLPVSEGSWPVLVLVLPRRLWRWPDESFLFLPPPSSKPVPHPHPIHPGTRSPPTVISYSYHTHLPTCYSSLSLTATHLPTPALHPLFSFHCICPSISHHPPTHPSTHPSIPLHLLTQPVLTP